MNFNHTIEVVKLMLAGRQLRYAMAELSTIKGPLTDEEVGVLCSAMHQAWDKVADKHTHQANVGKMLRTLQSLDTSDNTHVSKRDVSEMCNILYLWLKGLGYDMDKLKPKPKKRPTRPKKRPTRYSRLISDDFDDFDRLISDDFDDFDA